MNILLLLTKEDITTHILGEHFVITTQNGVQINMTPDAVDELVSDIAALREEKVKEKNNNL